MSLSIAAKMVRFGGLVLWVALSFVAAVSTAHSQIIEKGDRVVFLGDSNTYAGTWIDLLDAWQRNESESPKLEILNLGLSSETASGLSEPSHPFPRPDVRERLDRVIDTLKPNVVFVCYGMNDGIYHPFQQERFAAYQSAIREICERIQKASAKVVLITPPPFDPLPLKKKGKLVPTSSTTEEFSWQRVADDYDKTIAKYASWIRDHGSSMADMVIDIHTPLSKKLMDERRLNPNFSFSGDGVHFDAEGHRQMAKAILLAFGHESELHFETEMLKQITNRQRLLRDAYLTATGHKRPGVPKGLPLEEALQQAASMEFQRKK